MYNDLSSLKWSFFRKYTLTLCKMFCFCMGDEIPLIVLVKNQFQLPLVYFTCYSFKKTIFVEMNQILQRKYVQWCSAIVNVIFFKVSQIIEANCVHILYNLKETQFTLCMIRCNISTVQEQRLYISFISQFSIFDYDSNHVA